jgi:hypothetical protein
MDSNVSPITPEVRALKRQRGQDILAIVDWLKRSRVADPLGIAAHVKGHLIELTASLIQERVGAFDALSLYAGLTALSNTQPLLFMNEDQFQQCIKRALPGIRRNRF